MCTGGRILDHLVLGLSNPKNDIFFVGYQASGTLGRDIIKYSTTQNGYVFLDHDKIPIQAFVHELSGYSAHADQQGLLDWVNSMPDKPEHIKLVHGNEQAREALRDALENQGHCVAI